MAEQFKIGYEFDGNEYLLFNGRLVKTAVLFATPLPDRQSSEQTPTCHIYLLLGVLWVALPMIDGKIVFSACMACRGKSVGYVLAKASQGSWHIIWYKNNWP